MSASPSRSAFPFIIAAHVAFLMAGCVQHTTASESYPPTTVRYGSIKDEAPATPGPASAREARMERVAATPFKPKPKPAVARVAVPDDRPQAPSKPIATSPAIERLLSPPLATTEAPLPSETGVSLAGATERTTPVQRPASVERPPMVARPPLQSDRPDPVASEEKQKSSPAKSPVKAEAPAVVPQPPVTPKIVAPAPAQQPPPQAAPKVAVPPSPAAPRAPLPSDPPAAAAPKTAPTATDRPSSAARREAPAAPSASGTTPAPIEGVAALIERTNLMLRIGNVQGARGILEDAVKAKNPDAIAELGRTYDPNELKTYLVPPSAADPAKAMELYTEAARLGSTVARTRLERLRATQPTAPAAPAKHK